MDTTRISLARALSLGVSMTWREAAAIVYEAMARTGPTKGVRPAEVDPDACLLTRGGDLVLEGDAARARPETVLGLLDYLLPACDSQGGLGAAYAGGRAGQFLDELALQVSAKRRRVEIAGVAIRALGLEADARRVEAERRLAEEEQANRRRELERREVARVIEFAPDDAGDAGPGDEPIELPADLPLDLLPADDVRWRPRDAHVPAAARTASPDPTHGPAAAFVAAGPDRYELWPRPSAPPRAMAAAITVDDEFQQLRAATLRAAASAQRLNIWDEARRFLLAARIPVAAGAAVTAVASIVWLTWPAPALRVPAAPGRSGEALVLRPKPLPPDWAAAAERPVPPPSRPTGAAAPLSAPAVPAPPPPSVAPPVVGYAPSPTAAPGPVAPAVPAAPPPGVPAVSSGGPLDDAVFSAATPGVTPPVMRSSGLASTALKGPGEAIAGPYFEVLVGVDGSVETVRIRGRVEPGETFYRHRMMLAAAKMWRFTPATLNGRPVRYVARVVLDEP